MSPGRVVAIVLLTCLAVSPAGVVRGDNTVADAKRRAAAELLRGGKTEDAVAMLAEVTQADPDHWQDQLSLGRAYDRLNRTTDAIRSYRNVLAMLPPSAGGADERSARAEAERRLKVLDHQSARVDGAVDDFLKKLDALEKDAAAGKNFYAVDRIWRLRAGLLHGDGRPDRGGTEVLAALDWQPSGYKVVKGAKYRVSTCGTWRMSPRAADECTAAGLVNGPKVVHGPKGMLIGAVDAKPPYLPVGQGGEFVAPETGMLWFVTNEAAADKADNSGSISVVVVRE